MRPAVAAVLLILVTSRVAAQTPSPTVADSLMERWVEIYNTDDAEALEGFYAEGVATSADGRTSMLEGREAVLANSIRQMGVTDSLEVHTLYSYEEGDEAYHIGRFTIDVNGRPTTGAYTFFFRRDQDRRWRLRYTYYVHDPAARLEEFEPERE